MYFVKEPQITGWAIYGRSYLLVGCYFKNCSYSFLCCSYKLSHSSSSKRGVIYWEPLYLVGPNL